MGKRIWGKLCLKGLYIDEDEVELEELNTPISPDDSSVQESSYTPNEKNAGRYFNMFQATLEILKDTSLKFLKQSGSVAEMYAREKTVNPLLIRPFWVIKFISCNAEAMTTYALEYVPLVTKSVLGDIDLSSDNFIEKFQTLPRISSGAYDFHAGEYVNISSRVSTDNKPEAAETQHVIYHGATSAKNTGNRIRGHLKCLAQTISENEASFAAVNKAVPYHFKFGCQPDPVDTGPTFKCYTDFRSLGHITENDPSKTVWPCMRELINQILFTMLPLQNSIFRCPWYTEEIKTVVKDIRGELEAMFESLPDLSSVSLNRGCCLRETPRLGRGNRHDKCVSCPRVFTPGLLHGQKGVPWEAIFRLFEQGNPF